MNDTDPDYREIIQQLRSGGHFQTPPPSTPESDSGRIPPMSDWEPRVNRLETGVLAGAALLFGAIVSSYLMTVQKIDDADDKIAATTVAVTELKGSVKLLDERTAESNKRLERIEAKLDALAAKP